MFLCVKDYLYYAPSYMILLVIFAFSNGIFSFKKYLIYNSNFSLIKIVNDLSWGTKGEDRAKDSAKEIESSFLDFKIYFMGKYLLLNLGLTAILWIVTISQYT